MRNALNLAPAVLVTALIVRTDPAAVLHPALWLLCLFLYAATAVITRRPDTAGHHLSRT